MPEDSEIHEAVDGWLHCFRDPDRMLPADVPRMLWSESDTMDPFMGARGARRGPGIFGVWAEEDPSLVPHAPGIVRKRYDLIYRWVIKREKVGKLAHALFSASFFFQPNAHSLLRTATAEESGMTTTATGRWPSPPLST